MTAVRTASPKRCFRRATVSAVAEPKPSLAEGILLPSPVRGAELLAALAESEGAAVAVSEEQIADGVRALGAQGFAVEPTSAVVWHGLVRLDQAGALREGDTVHTRPKPQIIDLTGDVGKIEPAITPGRSAPGTGSMKGSEPVARSSRS